MYIIKITSNNYFLKCYIPLLFILTPMTVVHMDSFGVTKRINYLREATIFKALLKLMCSLEAINFPVVIIFRCLTHFRRILRQKQHSRTDFVPQHFDECSKNAVLLIRMFGDFSGRIPFDEWSCSLSLCFFTCFIHECRGIDMSPIATRAHYERGTEVPAAITRKLVVA